MNQPLTIQNLCKTYKKGLKKKVPALRDVNLSVQSGQVYGFVGPNGAGKSTTIKIALGLLRPDSGEVGFFGQNSQNYRARARVGFVPEEPNLYDHLTGKEFLYFASRLAGVSKQDISTKTNRLLERVNMMEAGERRLRTYSKGMQQRLALAQALVGDPELIIMDEPLSGLDPVGRMEIQGLISSLKEQGKTIFFSSHILSDVESICDQVALIINGEIKYTGTPENIEETFKEML